MHEITRNPVMTAPTRDTHTVWETNNPIIPEGVLCITKNRLYEGSVEYFVGDGVKTYTELEKFGCVGYGALTEDDINVPDGIAGLDADGKIDPAKIASQILDSEPQANQLEEGEIAFVAPANTDSAFVILNEEPTTSTLAEGQIAFVVEA